MAANQLGLFMPESNWERPKSLPDLSSQSRVAVDLETKDHGLANGLGPGWPYPRQLRIAGVAASWQDHSVYIPITHPESDNFEEAQVRQWLAELMRQDQTDFLFHNSLYDLGCMRTWDIAPPRRIHDTQAMAVMLDENQFSYSLDNVARRLGIEGKDEQLLREAAAALGLDAKAEMYKMPSKFVGPYAEQDGTATLKIGSLMMAQIEAQGLSEAYQLEMDIIPMILEMRARGIRIDESKLEQNLETLKRECQETCDEIKDRLDGWSHFGPQHLMRASTLQAAFDQENVTYPKTGKTGVGSFQSDWLENHEHWLPQSVVKARQLQSAGEKFLGQYIQKFLNNGRLHAEIHPLRDDTGGTRSYRFSYSNPPLQQMPARREYTAKMVRGIFLPEKGQLWGALDYSQQEPRLTVHYANAMSLTGAAEAVDYYNNDPNPDYHDMVAALTGLPRKQAKIINLGLAYGMGKAKLAASLGVSIEEAERILKIYHAKMPFIRALSERCQAVAQKRGWIKLIDGARCRFDLWEPRWVDWEVRKEAAAAGHKMTAAPREEAIGRSQDENHPWYRERIQRAFTHKSMNRLIQGSAARQTKVAMRECWREGIVPMIQMHDELGFSLSCEEDGIRAATIMREAVPVVVPMKVDAEYGINWGAATQSWEEAASSI